MSVYILSLILLRLNFCWGEEIKSWLPYQDRGYAMEQVPDTIADTMPAMILDHSLNFQVQMKRFWSPWENQSGFLYVPLRILCIHKVFLPYRFWNHRWFSCFPFVDFWTTYRVCILMSRSAVFWSCFRRLFKKFVIFL